MTLPDISRFFSLPDDAWRALGQRLKALGLTPSYAAPIVAAARELAPPLRRPLRAYHLRRMREPGAYAMRLLLFNDPVTEDDARAALGELVGRFVDIGLLRRLDDGRIDSPFVLSIVDDLYVLSDDLRHGADAVMGFGETTVQLCRAALPSRPVESALDLGCGSGTCALVLSGRAARVVGTDINPRAVALARVNAAINGITNVEFREGDLFAPARSEAYDIIASQPPFIPMPDGVDAAAFLYGGRFGDELSLKLLSGLSPHLAPEGRALVMVEWPDHGSEPLERRVAAAASPDLNIVLLKTPATNLDEHAAAYAAAVHPLLDAAFEREALLRREHLERAKIRGLYLTLTVVERASAPPGWISTVSVEPIGRIAITSDRIDKIMAASSLAGSRDRLLAAALRVPEGTVFSEEQRGPGADVPSTIWARFSETALVPPIQMRPDLLGLVTIIHESPTVREGVQRFADAYEVSFDDALGKAMPSVERALLYGLLEVA